MGTQRHVHKKLLHLLLAEIVSETVLKPLRGIYVVLHAATSYTVTIMSPVHFHLLFALAGHIPRLPGLSYTTVTQAQGRQRYL